MEDTKSELQALGCSNFDNVESSEDEQCSTGGGDENTTNIGDDICLEDLTGNVKCEIYLDSKWKYV